MSGSTPSPSRCGIEGRAGLRRGTSHSGLGTTTATGHLRQIALFPRHNEHFPEERIPARLRSYLADASGARSATNLVSDAQTVWGAPEDVNDGRVGW